MGFGLSPAAHAALLTVTSLADAGPGTLRDQVAAAAPGDTVNFSVTGIIEMQVPAISISKDLTITGPGAGSLTLSGTGNEPVAHHVASLFDISSGIVGISGLTLSDAGGTGGEGGAIHVTGGTVTIASTTLSDNAADRGGAIHVSGGTLAVTDSTFSNNQAGGSGGAIAVVLGGTLTVKRSTISDNRAYKSGGGISNSGTATIEDSTISGNIVPLGPLNGYAGGIVNGGFMIIRNCTISGNRSESVSNTGLTGGGGIRNFGPLTIANSTITDNFADKAGGIMNEGPMDLSNTILAGNTVSLYGPDILSEGSTGTNNIVGQDPKIGPLANNGGPTLTHALLVGSPAIDAGDPAFDGTNVPYDQRGPGFTRVLNGRVCIGACEANFDQGASLIVNTLDDHDDGFTDAGDCTLREAVRYASVGGSITFSVAGTITLTSGEMRINKSLTITGPAAAPGITVSGNNASRIFWVTQGATAVSNTVNFSRLTLTGGNGVGSFQSGVGGAIHSDTFTPPMIMTVTNCTLSGNHTEVGGAIRNGGTMTVTGSTFSGNSASINAGAIQNGPNVLTLTNSTFSGNSTTGLGANGIGGALRTAGSPTVTNCTFSGNTATLRGGAIEIAAGATPSFSNTIVAGNSAPTGPDINGIVVAGDYNLVQSMAGATLAGTHNLTGQAALLGALADNGGRTQTHALLAGSPAIDAGSNALVPGGATMDQRGFARVDGGTVDIGAFEVDVTAPSVTIDQAVGQSDPTISTPVHFTVVFSEAVTEFTTGDVALSGSAGATTATVTGSGSTYDVAVSGMTGSGTVIATIAAGAALDAAANGSTVSTSSDNAVFYFSAVTVQHGGTIHAEAGGGYSVGFIGNAGQEYTIQFSAELAPGGWLTLRTQVADSSGVVSFFDNPPAGTPMRFYRMILP
ncbi:choice-of-anchor Q domain-containing protein [Luteolibacter sp. Populi]|uniref:choice-of-anchor Q domain-containing protein n=1 Tax=Luteolibacter sp. Populi TaxID=3230487 RepID=UPI0034669205